MKMHLKTLLGMLLLVMLAATPNTWAYTLVPSPANPSSITSPSGAPVASPSDRGGCATPAPGQLPNPNCVPEIDATGTLPALALLGGVVALVRERKRRK